MRRLLPLVLAAASLALAAEPPAEGTKAPDFTLPSQDGSAVSLHDFAGKWVVLYFYPKDRTSGCTVEAHNFQRDLPQYDKKNAVILGVSEDSVDSHKDFCTKESLTFKLLADNKHEMAPKYGSLSNYLGLKIAARNTFLIDPKGVIRKVYLNVDPKPHSAEVLQALTILAK
jgi:peroxiredoxin Q/BCP